MSRKIKEFVKKEVILIVAWLLAIISMFVVHPSGKYLEYIDWRTLGILWSLMIIMEGLKQNGFFDTVGNRLLNSTKNIRQLVLVLVYLCFFFSMIITNDVALITFVPFAVLILRKCNCEEMMIPVIVLQTIAANLGSMLTPIGNPQNLYLYELSGVSLGKFIEWMLPYTVIAGLTIIITVMIITKRTNQSKIDIHTSTRQSENNHDKINWIIYFVLFIMAILVVSRMIPFYVLVVVVFVVMLLVDRKLLFEVDYSLLFTFVGFFIFTGNVENINQIHSLMQQMVDGSELLFGIALSQIISNVPAALLLSNFTTNIKALVIGVNFGGLGTLIASMASLISYKVFVNECDGKKGRYLARFTALNIIYLLILLVVYTLLK